MLDYQFLNGLENLEKKVYSRGEGEGVSGRERFREGRVTANTTIFFSPEYVMKLWRNLLPFSKYVSTKEVNLCFTVPLNQYSKYMYIIKFDTIA